MEDIDKELHDASVAGDLDAIKSAISRGAKHVELSWTGGQVR